MHNFVVKKEYISPASVREVSNRFYKDSSAILVGAPQLAPGCTSDTVVPGGFSEQVLLRYNRKVRPRNVGSRCRFARVASSETQGVDNRSGGSQTGESGGN